jgi:hypothetical protein
VDDLCARFFIPRGYPAQPSLYYGDALKSFTGVIGHAMVRPDKSDPAPDVRLWRTLEDVAGLRPMPIWPDAAPIAPAPLTDAELDALFGANVRRLDLMHLAAGSLVKTLLMELERRRVYVKLKTPLADTHRIEYDVLQGEQAEVARLGEALGFKRVTERELEVEDDA